MATLSELFADFICEKKPLSEEVIHLSKRAILDCVGAMVAGSVTPVCKMAESLCRATGTATAVGLGSGYAPEEAAFINGISGHELELDDTASSNMGHPTVAVLPAVLALAESRGESGRALIESFAVATEIECKIGRICARDLHKRGWHASSITGVLGAAAGCSYLLGHSREKVVYSLGIAASMASGIRENFGTSAKSVHIGKCAQDGLKAALLAESGFTASPSALDGREGYLFEYANCRYEPFGEDFAKTLGNDYDICSPGFSVKQYPSCSSTHRPLDAFLDLARENPQISAESVRSVSIGLSQPALRELVSPYPKTGDEAKFSVGFQIALALLGIDNMPQNYREDVIERTDMQRIIQSTRMYNKPEYDGLPGDMGVGPAHVTVELADGTVLEKERIFPVGHKTDPLSDEGLKDKFLRCTLPVLGKEKAELLHEKLMRLDELGNLSKLTDLTL